MIPVTLNKDWNLITRTMFALLCQPALVQGQDSTFGLGDMQYQDWVWGDAAD